MKRRIFVIALVLCVFGSFVPYANAAEGYIKNFGKVNNFKDGQFADVGSEWYADSVRSVYEIGLMVGSSDSMFNPLGNLSNAEAVAVAARLHSIYNTGKDTFTSGSIWYQPYMDYAIANNICDNDVNPQITANRAFFAGILGNAVDRSILTQKNVINDGDLYDVNGWYANSVYSFYRAGVLSGNDEYGTFAPDLPITRAEVAAILVRIVKPDKRTELKISARPSSGTYSIMQDDGSLEAYRQRAIVANLQVLLNGQAKDERWNNDIYYINHKGSQAIKPETIVIPKRYIDSRYSDYYGGCDVMVFRASHINPSLSGEISIPVFYVTSGIHKEIDGKSYSLSVINTGGKVDFFAGSIINGDLQLYCEGTSGSEDWTETITYDSYAEDAQKMIDNASFAPQKLDASKIKNNLTNEKSTGINGIKVGQLTNWEDTWCITINEDDMYIPAPKNTLNNKTDYEFKPSGELKTWCEKHSGQYVAAATAPDINVPVRILAISGYNPSKEAATLQTWDYRNGTLTLKWKYPDIEYKDVLTFYDDNDIKEANDTTGLLPAEEHPLAKTMPLGYGGNYRLNFKDDMNDFSNSYFHIKEDGDNLLISVEDLDYSWGETPKILQLTLLSDNALVDGKTVTIKAPKKINGIIYLPAEFIVKNLFNKTIEQ